MKTTTRYLSVLLAIALLLLPMTAFAAPADEGENTTTYVSESGNLAATVTTIYEDENTWEFEAVFYNPMLRRSENIAVATGSIGIENGEVIVMGNMQCYSNVKSCSIAAQIYRDTVNKHARLTGSGTTSAYVLGGSAISSGTHTYYVEYTFVAGGETIVINTVSKTGTK